MKKTEEDRKVEMLGATEAGRPLSEKEELQLIKYTDNECGFFGRMKAKYLISHNPRAAEFVNSLTTLSNEFPSTEFAVQDMRVNLWEKISRRIDQEEKAEFYLGTRVAAQENKQGMFEWNKLNLGISSGLVAACLALFFTYSQGNSLKGNLLSAPDSQTAFLSSNGNLNPDISNVSVVLPSKSSSRAEAAKLDWLRSHGKIKMIKDSDNRFPIIWVNRNLSSSGLKSGRGSEARVVKKPSLELFDLNENSSSTPIMLRDNSPKALSVIDRGRVSGNGLISK